MIIGRGRLRTGALLLCAAMLASPVRAQSGDGEGKEQGQEESFIPPEVHVCLGCHTIDRAGRQGTDAAPPLWNVMDRSPSVEGVEVERWTAESLQRWLANPRAMAPRTSSRFPGYADPAVRERVIEFLQERN
ncbi:c-type cytochrome [Thiohalorhabdus sp. Cl-TMA]|uniref:Cytochrome c family protein n=1 Tax=Thiohalorhabdus methylotrophus TaxID=3242694 RepID=A0ABV4TT85_9GAMM